MPASRKIDATGAKSGTLSAKQFADELGRLATKHKSDNAKFFSGEDEKTKILNVRMGVIFTLAKKFMSLSLSEIEKLLENPYYEIRMGAVSIMDFQARDKKTTPARKKELYDLYMNRHDRINNWDLVDRSAPFVVGSYLLDKSRAPLYKLAKSKDPWKRRTAIVSTYFFIRKKDIDDTFKIAEVLVHDKHELVNKAVGSWIREAGKQDKRRLLDFLDNYASTMPRITLRYAIEKLDQKTKAFYLNKEK